MSDSLESFLPQCLKLLLRPLIQFAIRHGVSVQTLIESVKVVFIEAAAEEMAKTGEKVNVSRLSVLTGLHRRDVMRIYREGNTVPSTPSLASRVIGQWEQDSRFSSRGQKPKILSIEGDTSEFRELVRSVSTDVNPGTVLFELERQGLISRQARGIKLEKRAHLVGGNPVEAFTLLADDENELIRAVEHNVLSPEKKPNLHAKTEYDNIRLDALPSIREWFLKEGAAFHAKARHYLAKFDQDISPEEGKVGGGRVVLGTFSRVCEPDDC